MPPERTTKRKNKTGPISKASPKSRNQNAKISERPVKKPPTGEESTPTAETAPEPTPRAAPSVAPKTSKSTAVSASKSAKTPSSTQGKKQVSSGKAQKPTSRHASPKKAQASPEPSSHAEPPSSSASTIEHSPPKVKIPHYKAAVEDASSPRNNVSARRKLRPRKFKEIAQKQIKANAVERSNAKSEELRGNKSLIPANADPLYLIRGVSPWDQQQRSMQQKQREKNAQSVRDSLSDGFDGNGPGDETGGRKQQPRKAVGKGPGLKRTMKEGGGKKEVEKSKGRRKRQKEAETEEEEEPQGQDLEDRTGAFDNLSREEDSTHVDQDGDYRMEEGEGNEETQEAGQEDVDEEVDDENMNDAIDDQDDDQGMGTRTPLTDHDGDTLMEEEEHGTEAGQDEIDDETEDFEMGDGSVHMDREGNATVHKRVIQHDTIDGSVQEEMEIEGGLEGEEDQGEETDIISESELGDEASNGGQSGIDGGGDNEGNSVMSPVGATDKDEEDEDGEEEEEEENEKEERGEDEEYEADPSELEEEEKEEEEEEGEGEKVQEEEDEENDEEMEDEGGAAEDPANVDAGADAQTEEAEDDEAGNTTIYNHLKDLIKDIPSKHFVYCRKLNQPNDKHHVIFKVYNDGNIYPFDTQDLQHSTENRNKLLRLARAIYEKQYGWGFSNLPRDFTFYMKERRNITAETNNKKKTAKGQQGEKRPIRDAEYKDDTKYQGNFWIVDDGKEGERWEDYIRRLAREASEAINVAPEVPLEPQMEHMWIWGEKTLFPIYDLAREKVGKDTYDVKHAGRLLVILAGVDYEGGEFAFSCEHTTGNTCHFFDPGAQPCLIASLSDGGFVTDVHPLTSGYRIGLTYQLRAPNVDMGRRITTTKAVININKHENKFLKGFADWRKRVEESKSEPNGIQKTVYYILKRQTFGGKDFDPLADLTPGQKIQLAWLCKLCGKLSAGTKRIGDQVYDWQLNLDLVTLSVKTFSSEEGTGPGFEVKWKAPADIERGDWDRNDADEGMEVNEEAVINFGDPGFGSTGSSCDEYLCLRLLVD